MRWTLFRVAGVPVRVDLSWVAVAILITWSLAEGYFPARLPGRSLQVYWAMGLAGALGLFGSILLHELAHALTARRFDVGIRGITLFIFGGLAEMDHEPPTPRAEFSIAAAGPLMTYLLAAIFGAASAILVFGPWVELTLVTWYLCWINGLLATFNLFPAFPLDGGRVLRSLLWRWRGSLESATRTTSRLGGLFGLVMIGIAILFVIRGSFIAGLWIGLIGMFLRQGANLAYHQTVLRGLLARELVGELMRHDTMTVPRHLSLQQAIDDYFAKHPYRMYPVVDGSELLGAVNLESIERIPPEEWGRQTIGTLVAPPSKENSVAPGDDAWSALIRLTSHRRSRLMVVDEGRLVGMIWRRDITEVLSHRLDAHPSA